MKWIYGFYGIAMALVMWTIWQIWLQLDRVERFESETVMSEDELEHLLSTYENFGLEVHTPHGTDSELGDMMAGISEVGNQLNEDSRYDRVDERILAERRAEKNKRSKV